MAKTVNSAFKEFMKNTVNLDPNDTAAARDDRNKLRDRIHALEEKVYRFPRLATDDDIDFGSFARRTKKRPLDDVDMLFCLHADGCTFTDVGITGIDIDVNNSSSNLNDYKNAEGKLSSIKVLNKFKSSAAELYQYRSADLNRRQESVVLKLNGKDWRFDIVPCFITTEVNSSNFYLIPDGNGKWKKTDPRIDQKRITENNKHHEGNLLSIVRLAKYWNSRATMPSIGSYLLENMVINCFANSSPITNFMDLNIVRVLDYMQVAIFNDVYDPKGFYGNLNELSDEDKRKVSERAILDLARARHARELEDHSPSGSHKECINKWREVFGPEFPIYA
ncbi:nucleotidyltransferase [Vreelandella titanicae]|uniref:SMODS domain-containing nucleotidyltransferase n=1 Tax=Vreelandella titanicae TaxID=664683 RepID=UPI001ECE556B|nr:nucleotidyltransferase [Halomonas sp.]MBL1269452.1 nucleotidyltransferase [Halomonas sp.]